MAERVHVFTQMRGRALSVGEELPHDLCRRIQPWWRPGTKWGLWLTEAVPLSEPIPMRGAGGLWRLPEEVHDGRNWGKDGDGRGPIAQWALEQWRKGRAIR